MLLNTLINKYSVTCQVCNHVEISGLDTLSNFGDEALIGLSSG